MCWLVCLVWLFATPTYGQNASLIFTDEDSKVLKTEMLAKADKDVYVFFAKNFGQSIENPIVLIGTSDPSLLNENLSKALKEMGRRQQSSPLMSVSCVMRNRLVPLLIVLILLCAG